MSELEKPSGAEFGERDTKNIPFNRIEVLPQIRKKMDQGDLEDLAASLDTVESNYRDNVSLVDLISDLHVAELDETTYLEYVTQNADFFERSPVFVEPQPDGLHYVLVAGHRRCRAINLKQDELGFEGVALEVPVKSHKNLPFRKAFLMQMKENNHARPATQDEATEAAKYYQLRKSEEPNVTRTQCARELGWKADRLHAACKYDELPPQVKLWVEERMLTFTNAVDLHELLVAYRTKGASLLEYEGALPGGFESIEEYASYELQTKTSDLIQKKLIGQRASTKERKVIKGWVMTIRPTGFVQDALLLMLEDTPQLRRQAINRRLGDTAVDVLRYLGYEHLTAAHKAELASLIGATLPEAIESEAGLATVLEFPA